MIIVFVYLSTVCMHIPCVCVCVYTCEYFDHIVFCRFIIRLEQNPVESSNYQPVQPTKSAPIPSGHQKDTKYIKLEHPITATDTSRYDRFVIFSIALSVLGILFLASWPALFCTVPAIFLAIYVRECSE